MGLERFGLAVVAVLFVVIAGIYGAGLAASTVPVPTSALMLASAIGGLFVLNWSRRRRNSAGAPFPNADAGGKAVPPVSAGGTATSDSIGVHAG